MGGDGCQDALERLPSAIVTWGRYDYRVVPVKASDAAK
uniref:Uncharacterized protein n=1 Tax=Podoviridae sp. ctnCN2 TaxID=2825274 RepID=A0A8S5PMC3_9CAUD|nr:MAG TPA: hypothetical protein [Podoviridae sp. ctnCN2]